MSLSQPSLVVSRDIDLMTIRDSFKESVSSSSSQFFPNLAQDYKDVERVGHLFEFHVLPLIQSDHERKKKTFVSISKYLVALIPNLELERCERWSSDFENEQLPHDLWEMFERETRSSPFEWAEIFNKTAQFRKSTFSPKMTKAIQNQFSIFVSVLRSKLTSEKKIFLKIALDAIEYLENHEIDPGNLFVGTPPSDFISKSLVPIIPVSNLNEQTTTTNPSSPSSSPFSSTASFSSTQPKTEMDLQKQIMRWKALKNHPEQIEEEINQTVQHLLETQPKPMIGLVAVRISSIPRPYQSWFTNPQWSKFVLWEFVYCRLAEPVVSSTVTSVFVYLDPWETFCVEVPVDSVFHFEGKTSDIPFYEATKPTNVIYFSNPISLLKKDLAQCIGDKISSYFDEKYKTKSVSLTSELGRLDKLFDFNAKLEVLEASLSEFSASRSLLNEEVCEMLIERSREWATSIPCGYFFPPKLEIALDQITDFLQKTPTTIKKEISIISKHTRTLVLRYIKVIQSVLNGQRKKEMCDWWLSHIEKKADQYLKDCGYEHDVLPENYTEEKPKDLDSLKKNLSIVQDLIEEESEELENFVDETTLEVYEMLEKLLHEIEFVLSHVAKIDLKFELKLIKLEYSEEDIESVKKDYEYLMKVKQMDLELKEKRKQKKREKEPIQMTDAVPVSGLVMARFHIFRAECQTSLMIWEKKMSGSKIVQASRSNWPNDVLEQPNENDNLFGYCWSDSSPTLTKGISVRHFRDQVWDEEEIDFEKGEEAPPKLNDSGRKAWCSSVSLGETKRTGSGVWKKIEPKPLQDDGGRGSLLDPPSCKKMNRRGSLLDPSSSRMDQPVRVRISHTTQSFDLDTKKFEQSPSPPPFSSPPPLPKTTAHGSKIRNRKLRSPRPLTRWDAAGESNRQILVSGSSLPSSPRGDSPPFIQQKTRKATIGPSPSGRGPRLSPPISPPISPKVSPQVSPELNTQISPQDPALGTSPPTSSPSTSPVFQERRTGSFLGKKRNISSPKRKRSSRTLSPRK